MQVKFSKMSSRIRPSAIRNKLFDDPQLITFAAGRPAEGLFPVEDLITASQRMLGVSGIKALQYSGSEGNDEIRKYIAEVMMKKAGVDVTADNIMITSGSQEGIDLCGRMFIDAGSTIICENPTYTGALGSLRPYNPKFVGVEMDENGIITEHLEKLIKENDDVRLIYTVPDFHNPTGVMMSMQRRKELAVIAGKYNIPVMEDRPYSELNYDGEYLPSIKSFDKEGVVLSLGSFSKIFCPGLRMAWICADEEILQKFITIKQNASMQCSSFDQELTVEYLKSNNIYDHIGKLCALYKSRRDKMLECLDKYMPDYVAYNRPTGGFFIWVTIEKDIDTTELLAEAAKHAKVGFIPGAPFYADGRRCNSLRLSFSSVTEEEIEEGIERLANFFKERF